MRQTTYSDLAVSLEAVLRYIQANLDDALDVQSLADIAGYSTFHFQRSFRKLVGESPIEHVRRIRLERAAYRLRTTSDSVTSIAMDAGFDSIAGFSRAFEVAFAAPPTAYRSSEWKLFWQTAPSGIHYDPDNKFNFDPLVKDDAVSDATIQWVEPLHVLALPHHGAFNYRATWHELRSRMGQAGFDPEPCQQYSFTLEPRRPRQAWKVRGYVGASGFGDIEPPSGVEQHMIGGGFYLVKRMIDMPILLGDFWARTWQQDVPMLGVKPWPGCAYNHLVTGFDAPPHDRSAVIDIYLPIEAPQN